MSFRFKKFIVEDDRSTMRVGTDAVLLGSWAHAGNASRILDIGTGCGVIALMMAQRSDATITAIDIDEDSVNQASLNFRHSPWNKRLDPLHISFQDLANDHKAHFDIILSNPPWFSNSLRSPRERRSIARHDDHLRPGDLFKGVGKILDDHGRFYMIIPAGDKAITEETGRENNLFLKRQMMVLPKPGRIPNRVLLEFSFTVPDHLITEELIIRREDNSFTDDYMDLTKDFYIDF